MDFLRESALNLNKKSTFLHIFVLTPLVESNLNPAILRFYPDVPQQKTGRDARRQAEVRSKRKRSKITTLLGAHSRLGNLGNYPLPRMIHPRGKWVLSQITFTEILKTVFGTRKYPGYTPERRGRGESVMRVFSLAHVLLAFSPSASYKGNSSNIVFLQPRNKRTRSLGT